ncbi:DUF5819 family protein [Streptomyces flavalbus]|uniref:DUF5819 family protein n=1 Tax=Streptomyces flavalbus TaxID=2665155 RepID=A0ABW2WBS6_9ACTN
MDAYGAADAHGDGVNGPPADTTSAADGPPAPDSPLADESSAAVGALDLVDDPSAVSTLDVVGDPPAPYAPDPPRTGVAALRLPYQVGVALVLAVVAVVVCVHLGMVFLHVAPSNTVTKQHGEAVENWVYPEFEQNWKLFAPNPLQQNVSVLARAQVRTPDGGSRITGWYDLAAQDGRAIDGNLLPSHTVQNELRRAWDFYAGAHDAENRPSGQRGAMSEAYLRRIVVMRLDRAGAIGPGGVLERVQVRTSTTNVAPPDWSDEQVSLRPVHRELPWWPVPRAEAEGGIG